MQMFGIGAVAAQLGCSASLLRKLEAAGLLPPAARLQPGDRRVYDEADLAEIRARLAARHHAAAQPKEVITPAKPNAA